MEHKTNLYYSNLIRFKLEQVAIQFIWIADDSYIFSFIYMYVLLCNCIIRFIMNNKIESTNPYINIYLQLIK